MIGVLGRLLSPKLTFGLVGVLIVALGVLWAVLASEKQHSAKLSRRLAETVAALDRFKADVKAKTELARISDLANKNRVERDQEKERADHEAELHRVRADFAQRVRDYAKAHPGSGVRADLPRTAETATEPSPAGAATFVPVKDLEICAVNTAAAEGWLNWWKSVEAIER